MKKRLIILLLCAFVAPCNAKKVAGKSYSFIIPPDTKFEQKIDKEFYSFDWSTNTRTVSFFLLFPVPTTSTEAEAIRFFDGFHKGVTESLQKDKNLVISKVYHKITAGSFCGIEIEITIQAKNDKTVYQYIFLLRDGNRLWNAHLVASSTNDLTRTLAILRKAKKIKSHKISTKKLNKKTCRKL